MLNLSSRKKQSLHQRLQCLLDDIQEEKSALSEDRQNSLELAIQLLTGN